MPTEQLTLIAESLRLPAEGLVSFTNRGLSISADATEADLLNIGHRLFSVRSYTKWALGSLFAAMREKRKHHDRVNHPNDFDEQWVCDFCDAHQLDPKERREMMGVYLFYKPCETTPPLSFEHHREAMWGVDDGKPGQRTRALGYLTTAHTKRLSVTGLRRLIRSSEATTQPEPQQTDLATYGVVFDFMRFARREMESIDDYTPERARVVLHDLGEPTLAFIQALRERAAIHQPQTSTNPAKAHHDQKNRQGEAVV